MTEATGFRAQIATLSRRFWLSNVIELQERFSYYGLRTVLAVYLLLAVELGGPQLDNIQKGSLFATWSLLQTGVPIFSGGLSDKLGYRASVALAAVIKAAGYLVMGLALPIAHAITGGASEGVPGHPMVYNVLLGGASLIAFGTAVFKPGIQGLVAVGLDKHNNSLGWGIFYQVVNIGGFLGPILAAWLKVLDWVWVFVACAGIALSMIPVLFFIEEPPRRADVANESLPAVAWRTMTGIIEPRLLGFLAVFSGFWAMFHQLFDLLPNFIEDWVDTSALFHLLDAALSPLGGAPDGWEGRVPQEMMLNLNAGMIMLTAFAVGYITGRIRSMTSMLLGIGISAGAIFILGQRDGWLVLGIIAIFSIGEMLASPTKLRYMTEIAPPGRQGAYLGYVNATDAVGWTIGSVIAGTLYEEHGDKVALARQHLASLGESADAVKAIAKTEVLPALAQKLGQSPAEVESLLWSTYDPGQVWTRFALIGFVSMVGMFAYDRLMRAKLEWRLETGLVLALMAVVTGLSYGPKYAAMFAIAGMIGGGIEHLRRQASPAT